MTQLLRHTVAHFTKPSFKPQTNNQPTKKFFKSWDHLSTSRQNVQNSDFQSQFSMSKRIQTYLKIFYIEEYHLWSTFFVIDIFCRLQFLNHFIF